MSYDIAIRDPETMVWLKPIGPNQRSSIEPITQKQKVQVARAMISQDFDAAEVIGQTFSIRDVVCHVVELPDTETGEVKRAVRTVLIGPDGSRIGAVSNGVLQSLEILSAAFGPPPWVDGLVVTLKEEKSKGGRKYYVLDPNE